jgi:hypothetical protein
MKKLVGIVSILAMTVLLSQIAVAAQGGGKGKGRGQGQGDGEHRRPPVVFGVLQSVSGSTWTIKPEIPPHMRERAEDKGRDLPQLPEHITVTVNEQTKFWLDGQSSSASSFQSGDEIVVKLDKPAKQGGSLAVAVADPETARKYILEKMKERRGDGANQEGEGRRGADRRPRLIFGTVTSASGSSLTVTPEIPEFLKDALPNKGEKLDKIEGKLPASITVSLNEGTKFVVDKEEQSGNPFRNGDKVAILPQGEPGNASARIVSDYASAKARIQQRMEKRQQKREGRGRNQG